MEEKAHKINKESPTEETNKSIKVENVGQNSYKSIKKFLKKVEKI